MEFIILVLIQVAVFIVAYYPLKRFPKAKEGK